VSIGVNLGVRGSSRNPRPVASSYWWRGDVDRVHALTAVAVLGGAAFTALARPGAEQALAPWSGAALLVGGALIGVPHGSSDFVVAHRVLRPALGRFWLPTFLLVYLVLVGSVLLGWAGAPLLTLIGFIALSALHFGAGDVASAPCHAAPSSARGRRGLALAVRATTPLLPMVLLHTAGVAGFIAALAGKQDAAVLGALDLLRWPLLLPWGAALAGFVVPRLLSPAPGPVGTQEVRSALEVSAIALAAVALPPLLSFALYFCLVHAVRHMVDIAANHHPGDPRRAFLLAAGIVLPSAAICFAALALCWDGIVGSLDTASVIVQGLRLIAALTVPHMALEAWAGVAAAQTSRNSKGCSTTLLTEI